VVATTDIPAREDAALRERCGLVDRSERGKLALTGSQAKEFLQGQVTNEIEGLAPGEGCYAAFLNHKGKMLGDLRVLDLGDELWLDCERIALQELFNMIRRYKLGLDVELHKRTLERGLLSLIGPDARSVAGAQGLAADEHACAGGELGGAAVVRVVTDLGIDVICAAEDVGRVRGALESAGAEPVSESAAEVLRVESGRPRYGIDIDDSVIPQEAGLNERAVSFTKGCYVGQETVARLHYRGKPNRHLRGLRLSAPAQAGARATEPGDGSLPAAPGTLPAEPGAELRLGERVVGRLGTVVSSPRHGPIALALVRREAEPGARLSVAGSGAVAEVVQLPF
jgi:tRNA-modifying protein YgfZ